MLVLCRAPAAMLSKNKVYVVLFPDKSFDEEIDKFTVSGKISTDPVSPSPTYRSP